MLSYLFAVVSNLTYDDLFGDQSGAMFCHEVMGLTQSDEGVRPDLQATATNFGNITDHPRILPSGGKPLNPGFRSNCNSAVFGTRFALTFSR